MSSKVVIYTTEYRPYPGGIATYVYELAHSLTDLGYAVEVCVFGRPADDAEFPDGRFDVRILSEAPFSASRKIVGMAARISLHALKIRPSISIAADFPTIIALSGTPLAGKKVAVLHGTEVRNKLFTFLKKTIVYPPLARFDRVVANSVFTRNLTLEYHPYLSPKNVVSAHLGANQSWFDKSNIDIHVEEPLVSVSDGRKLLLTVGRLEPRKGLIYAIRAVASLPRELRREVTYVIAGKNVDLDYCRLLEQEVTCSEVDIRLVGPISDSELRTLYAKAFCLIHPAVPTSLAVEGFGLVLLEASAQGLPVISTYTDAIPEVVRDDVSGILVPPADSDALNQAVSRLLLDKDLHRRLSMNGPEHARRFSWEKHAENVVEGLMT